MILQPRVAVVSLLFLLSYLLLPSPSQQDPQKSLQTPAVKSYSSQKVLYTRDVKDTDNAEGPRSLQAACNYLPPVKPSVCSPP